MKKTLVAVIALAVCSCSQRSPVNAPDRVDHLQQYADSLLNDMEKSRLETNKIFDSLNNKLDKLNENIEKNRKLNE